MVTPVGHDVFLYVLVESLLHAVHILGVVHLVTFGLGQFFSVVACFLQATSGFHGLILFFLNYINIKLKSEMISQSRKSIKTKQIAEIVIAGKFRLGKKIGNGSFGTVFEGKDLKHNLKVAIKMESMKSRIYSLENEFKILKHL